MGDEETINPDFLQGPTGSAYEPEALPAIIVLSGVLIGRKFVLQKDKYTMGRGSHADIDTQDDAVSRTHAELIKQNGRVIITDQNSHNGLYINNCKVDRWTLKDGDTIRLGNTVLQFVHSKEKRVFQFGNLKITV